MGYCKKNHKEEDINCLECWYDFEVLLGLRKPSSQKEGGAG